MLPEGLLLAFVRAQWLCTVVSMEIILLGKVNILQLLLKRVQPVRTLFCGQKMSLNGAAQKHWVAFRTVARGMWSILKPD